MHSLITGASGGIGEDLARLLAADKHDLVLVSRSGGRLETLASELEKAHAIRAAVIVQDLAAAHAADDLAARLASDGITVDILVNNAGFGSHGPFVAQSAPGTEEMLQLNISTLTMLTRHLLPGMLERRRGRILNVASTAAFLPGPMMATYYASKAYVLSFSEALSNETAGTGVTVTCLCPGPTRTGFQARAQVEESRLIRFSRLMTSAEVARAGYQGMLAGRHLVVPGLLNKASVQALRVLPRRVAAAATRALHAE